MIESFFEPKSIETYHILCIFSVDNNIVEVNYLMYLGEIFEERLKNIF